MKHLDLNNVHLYCDNTINLYGKWESPTMIMCDGPYGVNGSWYIFQKGCKKTQSFIGRSDDVIYS